MPPSSVMLFSSHSSPRRISGESLLTSLPVFGPQGGKGIADAFAPQTSLRCCRRLCLKIKKHAQQEFGSPVILNDNSSSEMNTKERRAGEGRGGGEGVFFMLAERQTKQRTIVRGIFKVKETYGAGTLSRKSLKSWLVSVSTDVTEILPILPTSILLQRDHGLAEQDACCQVALRLGR